MRLTKVVIALLTTVALQASGAQAPKPPNIVLILCDDLGYGDLGSYGSTIPTPNIDRLASEGMRFTSALSANPVCSPSRAALLTGRYPTRVGVPRVLFPEDTTGLALDETTLAETLRARGYRTKCIGKWHLGTGAKYLPTARGFDEYFGIPYSNDMSPAVLMRNTAVIEKEADQTQLVPEYTREAVEFIRSAKGTPFFLYLPHTYPHIPLHASSRFLGKSAQGLYGDVVQELDWSTGEILKTLAETGLDSNTIVLFSSDNGPWYLGSPGRLRGRKGSTYDGGIRIPLLARWPGQIPADRVSNATISLMDLFPTLAKLAGAPLPAKPLDGVDAWPLLSGSATSLNRELLLHFDNWDIQAARLGPWKLHVARHNSEAFQTPPDGGRVNLALKPELYNLDLDPDESYDLADRHPEIVKEMSARIERLLPGFPPQVRAAWAATLARPSLHPTPGSRPRRPTPASK